MDDEMLIFAVIGLALFALTTTGEDTVNGGNGENGENGENGGPTTASVNLSIEGQGRARLLADGDPFSWTSSGYTKNVPVGSEITVEYDPDAGWEFARYTGTQPPFTV